MQALPRRPIDEDGDGSETAAWQKAQQEALREEKAGEYSAEEGYQADVDISHKTFRFNPPLHNSNTFLVPDLGNEETKAAVLYDEATAPASYAEKWAKEGLNTLRLGRIIQHHMAPGQSGLLEHRWGFRFLYNPTTISYVTSRNDSFVIDPRSETNRVLSGVFQNFQSASFTVLLDRTPDVLSGIPDKSAYSPRLSDEDREGILRYGTHWDMEALFKICNGEWDLMDRGKTGDMGALMPSNARLILGPGVNFYGFIGSVTWNHELFSEDMVPMRTRLDIIFRRHVDMSAEQAEKSFPGIASAQMGNPEESEEDDIIPEGESADESAGNTGGAPVPGYNKVTTAYGSRGRMWNRRHTGDDYGLGGISGKPVVATRAGVVKHIAFDGGSGGWNPSWAGNHVVIQTGNVQHGYCHLASVKSSLKVGMTVGIGTALGTVGTTGNSSGPHLHYEERVDGKHRKPIWGNK